MWKISKNTYAMNEPENTRLLRLYKLLWEQIKDKPRVYSLQRESNVMYINDEISRQEMQILDDSLYEDWSKTYLFSNTKNRKAFVQRMIKELENDKQDET